MSSEEIGLDRLLSIMRRLLAPGGCPWDRRQTHETLRPYLIEEAYEVIEAIDEGDLGAVCEELGDLQLQIVFHAELARKRGDFTLADVMDRICEKLIRRHPHVFADGEAETAAEVAVAWEAIKKQEGKVSICDGVPRALPALRRGQRLGERLAKVGFDWSDRRGPREKVDEELAELDEAVATGDHERIEDELGDLLFAAVNLGRHLGVDAEDALRGTLSRFERRFRAIEQKLAEQGRSTSDCTLDELEAQWQEVKRLERS